MIKDSKSTNYQKRGLTCTNVLGALSALPVCIVCVLFGMCGCNKTDGFGTMSGSLNFEGCIQSEDGQFSRDFHFMGLEKVNGEIFEIRLQEGGLGLEVSDGVLIQVYEPETVMEQRGTILSVHPHDPQRGIDRGLAGCGAGSDADSGSVGDGNDLVECPLIRITPYFYASCPDSLGTSLYAGGTISFSSFGLDRGDRIAGSFLLNFVDGRSGAIIGEDIEGTFSFLINEGQPFIRIIEEDSLNTN